MTEINRIKQLAGLRETSEEDDQKKLDDYEAMEAREKMVKQQIAHSFASLGIAIVRIQYDEHPSRDAVVVLDDEPLGWPLDTLIKINQLDYITNVKIEAYKNSIEVHFNVK